MVELHASGITSKVEDWPDAGSTRICWVSTPPMPMRNEDHGPSSPSLIQIRSLRVAEMRVLPELTGRNVQRTSSILCAQDMPRAHRQRDCQSLPYLCHGVIKQKLGGTLHPLLEKDAEQADRGGKAEVRRKSRTAQSAQIRGRAI
jgi:hypothetical protein